MMSKDKKLIRKELRTIKIKGNEINREKAKREDSLNDKRYDKVDKALDDNAFVLGNGCLAIKSDDKVIGNLLATTPKVAKQIRTTQISDKDKIKAYNSELKKDVPCIKATAIQKQAGDRAQELEETKLRDQARYTNQSIGKMLSSPEVIKQQVIGISNIKDLDNEQKKIVKKNSNNIDEVTGMETGNPEVHHKEHKKVDTDYRTFTKDGNYAVLDKNTHRVGHKKNGGFEDPNLSWEEQKEKVKKDLKIKK